MHTAIEILGSHVVKVWIGRKVVLFSYDTAVACWIDGRRYAVRDRISSTTSRHLKQYGPEEAELVSAAELDRLLAAE